MNRKTLIIGLDGATFDVIGPMMEQGLMPNLKKLMDKGASGTLWSTIPPVSGPAWLSLATGMKPGKTGVYDFCYRKGNSFLLQSISSGDYFGKSVWDYLSQEGKRVAIFNYPMCFPPYEVNGFLAAGITASSNSEFTFPGSLKNELNEVAGGQYELSFPYHDQRYSDTDLFLNDLYRILDKQVKATKYLLTRKPWDLFWVVFSITDWLQHLMWCDINETNSLYETLPGRGLVDKFREFWCRIDKELGEIFDIVGNQTNTMILSDHGFGISDQVFKLNAWLEREGYLVRTGWKRKVVNRTKKLVGSWGRKLSKRIRLPKKSDKLNIWVRKIQSKVEVNTINEIDVERSVAFDPGHTIPFGGIYVNERIADTPERKEQLTDEIAKKLQSWGAQNQIKIETWRGNKSGSESPHNGPDLLVGVNDWRCVLLKDQFAGKLFEKRSYSSRHRASHRMNGVFIAGGPDVKNCTLQKTCVHDIAPTILYLFNQPIPSCMDGQVLKDMITVEYLTSHPVKFQAELIEHKCSNGGSSFKKMTVEEESVHLQKLKDLGYM